MYDKVEVIYELCNEKIKIKFSTYMLNASVENISSCDWGSGNEREAAMKPIVNESWDMVEQILGYAVNDNFAGTLPFEEVRYFKVNNDATLEYSDDQNFKIKASIKIVRCY